jgi:NADH pyrophosphatase NudC (nudix superfamily)
MSIGSLLLGVTLLILVGLYLARPFLLANARLRRRTSLRQELLADKEGILAQIQVLEFDYETGTLPEEDYRQQREQLVAEAAEVLKSLDELSEPSEALPAAGSEKEIEAAVSRLRRQPRRTEPTPVKTAPKPVTVPKPAAVNTAEKSTPTNGQVKFCAQCGQPVEKADNFCAYCGHKIIQPQST